MTPAAYEFPVAISRLSEGETSREPQNLRAILWLADQPGGPVVVVTPRTRVQSDALGRLMATTGVTHRSRQGFSMGEAAGHRVLYCWPNRECLNGFWGAGADALAVIEWDEGETAEWIEDANPVQLLHRRTLAPRPVTEPGFQSRDLPNGVDEILEHIAAMAAGYSSGLKWNEVDKLKADMMNRPERWAPITVEEVRTKCRALGMRPDDVDTVSGFLQRRKENRCFKVQSSYRTFHFD